MVSEERVGSDSRSGVPALDLAALADREALRELVFALSEASDDRRWDDWEACFAEDANVVVPAGEHRGRSGLSDLAERSVGVYEKTVHYQTNLSIRLHGDTATGRTNFAAYCRHRGDSRGYTVHGGACRWTFRRGPGGWQVSGFVVDIGWTGQG